MSRDGSQPPERSTTPDTVLEDRMRIDRMQTGVRKPSAVRKNERRLTTAKAVAEAIGQEMERDPSIFYMGEDVGAIGSVFGVTQGLLERFGPERIMDTPISETGFVGAAIGAAINGMRPIVEIMFVDFSGVCFDQIMNHMAKLHYESGGSVKVPLVLTTAIGAGYNDAAQQSQSIYSLFAHIPGLKVVVPSTPYDAKGLMISAIRDDNPVLFFFHKGIMGLAWMYPFPLDAAEDLAKEGIEAEVLDLRTLVPLDREAIRNSIKKTGRFLVVDEDYRSYGMSGELMATAVEEAHSYLRAPPRRLATADVPIPFSPPLEKFVLPSRQSICQTAHELINA
jgi:pyruvate/2-oxoglutarate/acetoin dehydrogenase E1 component